MILPRCFSPVPLRSALSSSALANPRRAPGFGWGGSLSYIIIKLSSTQTRFLNLESIEDPIVYCLTKLYQQQRKLDRIINLANSIFSSVSVCSRILY